MGLFDGLKQSLFGVSDNCPSCKEKIKGADYQFREVSKKADPYQGSNKVIYKVRFDFVCPSCNTKQFFNNDFYVAYGESVQTAVELWAEKKFGK